MRKYTKKTKHAHAGTSTLHISPQSSIPFSDRGGISAVTSLINLTYGCQV